MTRKTATVIEFSPRRPVPRRGPDALRYPATIEVLAARVTMLLETLKVASS